MKILIIIAAAAAAGATLAERRAESAECQRRRMESRPGREVLPEDACVCNARVGLPETDLCRRLRGQR